MPIYTCEAKCKKCGRKFRWERMKASGRARRYCDACRDKRTVVVEETREEER